MATKRAKMVASLPVKKILRRARVKISAPKSGGMKRASLQAGTKSLRRPRGAFLLKKSARARTA
jgi:hypothetical protein